MTKIWDISAMKISIRHKIILIVLMVVILFVPLLFFFIPQRQQDFLMESYEHEAVSVAQTVALGVSIALNEHNFEGIQIAMNYAKKDKRVLFVAITQHDSVKKQTNILTKYPENYDFTPQKTLPDTILVRKAPFESEAMSGDVIVGFSTQFIKQKTAEYKRSTSIASFVITALCVILGYLGARSLSKPLLELYHATKQVGEGNLDYKIQVRSQDEIGSVANSFNEMVEKLRLNNIQLKQQKESIETSNKKIAESINYASRIQKVLLPNSEDLKLFFEDSMVFFKPKDKVSGDFFWLYEKENKIYVAVVDCTGHGVPGAMMSLIAHFLLEEIGSGLHIKTPREVLNNLHDELRIALKQADEKNSSKDGMDIALCCFDGDMQKMMFAGAHRNLLLFNADGVQEYAGNRRGIGGVVKENDFNNYEISLQKGDRIVLYSDGIPDQFGGENNKKYGNERIKNFFKTHYQVHSEKVAPLFDAEVTTWMQSQKQIDDMLLVGIRIIY